MKKPYTIFLCLLLLCMEARSVFPQDDETPDLDKPAPRGLGKAILHGLIGSGEVLLSNGIVMAFNIANYKITGNGSWSIPIREALDRNFDGPWEWEDTDGFKVNQLGHPYQGSLYFNAGRANGFNFYQSAAFSALGSISWEAASESNHASINDFIATTIGSLSTGEMLYRLYLEACASGVPAPLAALINPMAGFHRLVARWEPPDYGRRLYQLHYQLGTSYAKTNSTLSDSNRELFASNGFIADIGFSAAYGNPFEQNSATPFDHFELAMFVGTDIGNMMNIRLNSDGYLFSFSPVYTEKDTLSTGLSLHFDFASLGELSIYNGTIDHYSNALDWTIKYQHLFSENAAFQTKFHAGFTFMGVSEYYSTDRETDLKNYGAGLNSKLYIAFAHKKLGKLETNIYGYTLWTYPGTSALSQGTVLWLFTDVAYSRLITKHLSIGIADFFALEQGLFNGFPNTKKYSNSVKLFAAWNLK
jgi:hypothetical protein